MSRRDRKPLVRTPADAAATSPAPASDPVTPFVPTQSDVDEFAGGDVETAAGSDSGVEQAGHSPPDQIDPGTDGKLTI